MAADVSPSKEDARKAGVFYEDDYFDSDEEEDGDAGAADAMDQGGKPAKKQKKKVPVLSNDQLLFNDEADELDEKWVREQLLGHNTKNGITQFTPRRSDAVLTCPACFGQLCFDCQQHDIYHNQYRAMFVRNVRVRKDQILRSQGETKSKRQMQKEKRKQQMRQQSEAAADGAREETMAAAAAEASSSAEEIFWPVECALCTTEVAVLDQDEVYHFFNVLAGLPT